MGKIRRAGYVFVSWIGDHGNHVHVYKNGHLVAKWDLDHECEESGSPKASRHLKRVIRELRSEGKLGYEDKKRPR